MLLKGKQSMCYGKAKQQKECSVAKGKRPTWALKKEKQNHTRRMFSRMKENVLKNEEECSQERSGESTTKIRMIWQCHHITAITTSRVCLLSQSCSSRECLKNVLHLTNLHVLTSLHLKDKHTHMGMLSMKWIQLPSALEPLYHKPL